MLESFKSTTSDGRSRKSAVWIIGFSTIIILHRRFLHYKLSYIRAYIHPPQNLSGPNMLDQYVPWPFYTLNYYILSITKAMEGTTRMDYRGCRVSEACSAGAPFMWVLSFITGTAFQLHHNVYAGTCRDLSWRTAAYFTMRGAKQGLQCKYSGLSMSVTRQKFGSRLARCNNQSPVYSRCTLRSQ